MENERSKIVSVFIILSLFSVSLGSIEVQQKSQESNNFISASGADVESRQRRAPAVTPAPAGGGFFGGGFMQFLMQALCLQITSGGLGGGLGGGAGGLGGGLGPLLLGFGRKRRGAGGRGAGGRGVVGRGNRVSWRRPNPFQSRNPNALGLMQMQNSLRRLGISRTQSPAQILSNPRVRNLLASNPQTRASVNGVMANQAVGGAGGGGGGGGISTDQLINLVMQAMCLQQQAAAAATPLPAALNNRPPRPGRPPGRG